MASPSPDSNRSLPVTGVDPRWPLLNRWSTTPVSAQKVLAKTCEAASSPSSSTLAAKSMSLNGPKGNSTMAAPPFPFGSAPRKSPAPVTAAPVNAPITNSGKASQVTNAEQGSLVIPNGSSDESSSVELTPSTSIDVSKTQPLVSVVRPSPSTEPVGNCSNSQNAASPETEPLAPSFSIPKGAWERPLAIASPLHQDKPKISEDEVASLKAHSKDYPWAAKMNQSMRNLHRVTIPEFMEDGTPMVRIPSHVLLGGLENQKEFVLGQFHRCSAPSRGLIQAVVTRIWGRKCRIFVRKLRESTYLFHIPDESTRKWVIQRGLWHFDDCLMFVSPWSPKDTISVPEIATMPVWLTLNNIPDQLYSILGIKWIASGIGEPISTEKPWLDPTQMGKAKILVEIKLDKPFPQRVALTDISNEITMVEVQYSWLPSTCSRCGHLGHKASHCLLSSADSPNLTTSTLKGKGFSIGPKPVSPTIVSTKAVPRGENDVKGLHKTVQVPTMRDPTPPTSPITTGKTTTTSSSAQSSPVAVSTPLTMHSISVVAPSQETANPLQVASTSPPAADTIRKSWSSASLRNNRFSSLDEEEDATDEEDDTDDEDDTDEEKDDDDEDVPPSDFLTPSGKRILRDRPVKPSTKVKEMQWTVVTGGRGTRGRGTRGGRG